MGQAGIKLSEWYSQQEWRREPDEFKRVIMEVIQAQPHTPKKNHHLQKDYNGVIVANTVNWGF